MKATAKCKDGVWVIEVEGEPDRVIGRQGEPLYPEVMADYLARVIEVYHARGYDDGYRDGDDRGYDAGWSDGLDTIAEDRE